MKDKILKLIKKEQEYIYDNLYRANLQFKHLTGEQLMQQYGHSEKSCQSILDGYQKSKDEIQKLKDWALKNILN